jgi:hypothetical protein
MKMPVNIVNNTDAIKRQDNITPIEVLLTDDNNANYPIDGKTVKAWFSNETGFLYEKELTERDGQKLVIRIDPDEVNKIGIGKIKMEIVVEESDRQKIFPNGSYIEFEIVRNLKSINGTVLNPITLEFFEQEFDDLKLVADAATQRANDAADRVEALEPEIANMQQYAERAEEAASVSESNSFAALNKIGDETLLGDNPQTISKTIRDRGINPFDFGCTGDGETDDYIGLVAADALATTVNRPLLINGYFGVSQTFNLTAQMTVGIGRDSCGIIAISPMEFVVTAREKARMHAQDFKIDANNSAINCIDTSHSIVGPSLNNSFHRIFCRGYTEYGWIAENNNDVYFDEVFIGEPKDYLRSLGAIKAWGAGGPFQFNNCNFLDEVHVGGQVIAFHSSVARGVVIDGPGFNVVNVTGTSYIHPSKNTKIVFEIPEGNEAGPFDFSGSHLEPVTADSYLIGGKGKLHHGTKMTGGHVFNVEGGKSNLIQDTLTSTFVNCVLEFENTEFENINTPERIGGFLLSYKNCFVDGNPLTRTVSGNPYGYYQILDGDKETLGKNASSDGFQRVTGVVTNVGSGFIDLDPALLSGEGMYFVMLMSEALDAPKAGYMVGIPGSYGEVISSLNQTKGIASYVDLSIGLRVSNKKLQINASGGTGVATTIPSVRYAVMFVKWKQ